MGLDYATSYEGLSTTSTAPGLFGKTALGGYLSAWNVTESAGSPAAAQIKIRDNYAPLGAVTSAADGSAGNSTAGLHMFMVVGVTKHGEMWRPAQSSFLEFTTAGSKIINLTGVPVVPLGDTKILGRRVYITKAGAPATGVQPTTAQWFRAAPDLSTTIGATQPSATYLPASVITVASTTNFAASGNLLITGKNGPEIVTYTAVGSSTTFTGCTGGSGLLTTGDTVTQPAIGDNTTTTFAFNLADGSVATNPVTAATDGKIIENVKLGAGQSVGMEYPNPIAGTNGGGFQVQVVSGTVDFSLKGK